MTDTNTITNTISPRDRLGRLGALCAHLERRGWATNIPGQDDEWSPHAWPPRRRGQIPLGELRRAAELEERGLIGPLEPDGEGGVAARILLPPESHIAAAWASRTLAVVAPAPAPAGPPQAPPADWQARALAAAQRLTAASPEAQTIMAIVLDLYRERDTQAGLSAAVKRCRGSRAWTPALAEAVELVGRELGIEVCPDEAAALAFLGDRPRGLAERLLIAWGYPLLGYVTTAEAPSPQLDDQIQRMEAREARGGTRGIPSLPRRRLE